MASMSLSELTRGFADIPSALANISILDLVLDSRQVTEGSGFIAVQGTQTDGQRFIADALDRGASLVLAESPDAKISDSRVIGMPGLKKNLGELAKRFYGDPSRQLALLAVTGTNGKTSISDYIGQLLRLLGESAGTIGTLGARTRSGESVASQNTTPDIISLNRQLADWVDQGVHFAAIEASSHALDQSRLDGLTLHTGIFSNLTRDHLDYHENMVAYQQAKLRLFQDFCPDRVLYNADDENTFPAREFASQSALGISLRDASADVFAQVTSEAASGLSFLLHSPYGSTSITTKVHGRFNAFNVTAAIMAVCGLGFAFSDVAAAASYLQAVDGRMQAVGGGEDIRVVVDYAHTPDALASALFTLETSCPGDLWAVFGCGGDRDSGKRAEMGRIASGLASKLVITNDNPRTEDASAIASQIASGCVPNCDGADVLIELDRAAAIVYAIKSARPGDTVLIAGKGHETYQIIGRAQHAFSDVEHARQALAARGVADV